MKKIFYPSGIQLNKKDVMQDQYQPFLQNQNMVMMKVHENLKTQHTMLIKDYSLLKQDIRSNIPIMMLDTRQY